MLHTVLDLIIICYIIMKEFDTIKRIVVTTMSNINKSFVERRIIKAIIKSKESDEDSSQQFNDVHEEEEWNRLCRNFIQSRSMYLQEILDPDEEIEELFEDEIDDDLIVNVSFAEQPDVSPEELTDETYCCEDDTDPIVILQNAINSKIGNTKLYEMLLNINLQHSNTSNVEVAYGDVCI